MADPAARHWSVDEFFAWQERQQARYELVDGFPLEMLSGARQSHDMIVVNILASLRGQLRGSGRRPFTADGSVETRPGQIRRPDIGVDCGKPNPDALVAGNPRLVAEVLSPTTRDFDTFGKLGEYQGVASLEWILLIEPNAPQVTAWRRDGEFWTESVHEGLAASLEMASIGVTLSLESIYEELTFPAAPRLVFDSRRTPGVEN